MKIMPESDYANYTCVATNVMGVSQVAIELHGKVKEKVHY